MIEQAIKLADELEEHAQFIYGMILEHKDPTESAVAKQLTEVQVQIAKDNEKNAAILRWLVNEINTLKGKDK